MDKISSFLGAVVDAETRIFGTKNPATPQVEKSHLGSKTSDESRSKRQELIHRSDVPKGIRLAATMLAPSTR